MDINAWLSLLDGAWTTLWISALSMLLGVPLGLLVAMLRGLRIPVLGTLLSLYIGIVRAMPLVTLVLFLFVTVSTWQFEVDVRLIAIAALTINTTAFNAEIWRSAFANFPREQIEAAKAAGMTRMLTLRRIQLPQMLVTSLPDLVNEMTLLVKSSPAMAMVGLVDLTRAATRIGASTYEPVPPILAAWVMYTLIIWALVRLQRIADQYARRLAM